jgi:mono/diheme cytochrome c family protein
MSWKHAASAAIAITSLGASALAKEPLGHDPVLAEIGAPIFTRYCASCHGMDGRGNGPTAAGAAHARRRT